MLLRVNPALLRESLALWTVTISAGIVGWPFLSALGHLSICPPSREVRQLRIAFQALCWHESKDDDNIIDAVVSGYAESAFKDKIAELEDEKVALETRLKELGSTDPALNMDEETLRKLISKFKGFVQEKNIPECKKFIQSFVDRVVVYKDHVEVTLKVTSNFSAQNECIILKTEEKIKTLFRRFKVA